MRHISTPNTQLRIITDAATDELNASTLVTHQRGSWRWQDAYCVAYYMPRLRAKTGKGKSTFVWQAEGTNDKMSLPQAIRRGFCCPSISHGSLSQRPVTADQLMGLALLEEMGVGIIRVRGARS